MHCTAPVIVVCFNLHSYGATVLSWQKKGAWLLYSNEFLFSSETIQGDDHMWMQYGVSFSLQSSPHEPMNSQQNTVVKMSVQEEKSELGNISILFQRTFLKKDKNSKEMKEKKAVITFYPCTEVLL